MPRWSPWAWMPFVVIGITIIPNAVLFFGARSIGISKVEERPWLASARIDADKERRQAFAATSGFTATVAGPVATCRITGVVPAGAAVRAYRPSDAALDRIVAWTDPAQPLAVPLPVPGRWVLYLDLPEAPAVARQMVEVPP